MNGTMKDYSIEVWEVVARTAHVKARTAREAAEIVKGGMRPQGVYRRTIKSVRWER